MGSAAPEAPAPEAQRLLDDFVRVGVQHSLSDDLDDATTVFQASHGNSRDIHDASATVSSVNATTPPLRGWHGAERRAWLYRFATPLDDLLVAGGLLMAVASGALVGWTPCVVVEALVALSATPVDTVTAFAVARRLLWMACGAFALRVVSATALDAAATRQLKRLYNETARRALSHGDVPTRELNHDDDHPAWLLGSLTTGSITTQLHESMGHTLGDLVRAATQVLVSLVVVFVSQQDIGLCILTTSVLPLCETAVVGGILYAMCWRVGGAVPLPGAVAEPVVPTPRETDWKKHKQTVITNPLAQMRTVVALNAQEQCVAVADALWQDEAAQTIQASSGGFFYVACALVYAWFVIGMDLLTATDNTANHLTGALARAIAIGSATLAVAEYTVVKEAWCIVTSVFSPILDAAPLDATVSRPHGLTPSDCRGAIAFQDVSAKYEGQHVHDVTLSIAAGAHVVVVDAKKGNANVQENAHTHPLVLLMQRLVDPQNGSITLDGLDIEELDVRWLRQQIAVVARDPVLFGGMTIYENIAAGSNKAITRAQAIVAATQANVHDVVLSLPHQYDTRVCDVSPATLTRAHRQRLALARGIARDAKVLILDHIVDASVTHSVLETALNDLLQTTMVTTLVLTDRVPLLRSFDRVDEVVVMERGRIVECGLHNELMGMTNGVYKAMYDHDGEQHAAEVVLDDWLEVATSPDGNDTVRSCQKKQQHTQALCRADQDPLSIRAVATFLSPHQRKLLWASAVAALVTGIAVVWFLMTLSDLGSSMLEQWRIYQASQDTDDLWTLLALSWEPLSWRHVARTTGVALLGFGTHYTFLLGNIEMRSRARERQLRALCRHEIAHFDALRGPATEIASELYATADAVATCLGATTAAIALCVAVAIAAVVGTVVGTTRVGLGALVLTVFVGRVGATCVTMYYYTVSEGSTPQPTSATVEYFTHRHSVVSLGLEALALAGYGDYVDTTLDSLPKRTRARRTALVAALDAFLVRASARDMEEAVKAWRAILSLKAQPGASDAAGPDGLRPHSFTGKIEFRDVSFCDPLQSDKSQGLVHFSATIESGETVAFCGPPDGGQSSIAALLERFYDPTDGDVLIDGVDIKALDVCALRNAIGLVDHAPQLFTGGYYVHKLSIADNIAFGMTPRPPQRKIETAAKLANAHGVVEKCHDRYETKVVDPSFHSRHIALARAIIKNPSMLVLDDVASDVFNDTRELLNQAVNKVLASKKRTTILIGHCLTAVQRADKIFVLDNGRVVEQGTHDALLATGGLYAKLVEPKY